MNNWSEEETLDKMASHTIQALEALGMTEAVVPPRFALEAHFGKTPLGIEPRAFFAPRAEHRLSFARVVRVRAASAVQVLNVVLFPRCGSGLPVLGCEMLCFAKGVHLVVLDAFPLHQASAVEASLLARLKHWRALYEPRFGLTPTPQWGQHVFSEQALILKPGARAKAHVLSFVEPFEELLSLYLDAEERSEPAGRSAAIERRRTYLADHGHHEPAGPFLARLAGPQWVEDFVFEFLFPRWLYDHQARPEWATPALSPRPFARPTPSAQPTQPTLPGARP